MALFVKFMLVIILANTSEMKGKKMELRTLNIIRSNRFSVPLFWSHGGPKSKSITEPNVGYI